MNDRDFFRKALYMMIAWDCGRYCLCTYRGESAEKADIHWRISGIIASLIWGDLNRMALKCDWLCSYAEGKCAIHKYLTDELTDNMDKVLGMPLMDPNDMGFFDGNLWGDRMFDWIWNHWDEMCSLNPEEF